VQVSYGGGGLAENRVVFPLSRSSCISDCPLQNLSHYGHFWSSYAAVHQMVQIIPISCDEEVAVDGLAAFVLRALPFLAPLFVYVISCIRDVVVTLTGVFWNMTLNCKLGGTGSRGDNYRGPECGSREESFGVLLECDN
jgi:hypothetical protein